MLMWNCSLTAENLQEVELESPDLVVPRRNIASGKTPVAARESVIKYEMACKEDDYTYTNIFRYFCVVYVNNSKLTLRLLNSLYLTGFLLARGMLMGSHQMV